jgi:hypothetical protein
MALGARREDIGAAGSDRQAVGGDRRGARDGGIASVGIDAVGVKPRVAVAAPLVLAVVALAACLVPARRRREWSRWRRCGRSSAPCAGSQATRNG